MDSDRRKEIIGAYGSALERRKGMLALESDLPYPKSLIRRAIVQQCFEEGVDDKTLDSLGAGLIWLEVFLPDNEAALVQKTNAGFEPLKNAAAAVDNPEEVARHVDETVKDVAADVDPRVVLRRLDEAVKVKEARRFEEGQSGFGTFSARWDKAAATVRVLRELRGGDEQPVAVPARVMHEQLDKQRDERLWKAARPTVVTLGVVVAWLWMAAHVTGHGAANAGEVAIVGPILGATVGWITFIIWWAIDAWRPRDYYRQKNELLRAKDKAAYEVWLAGFQRRHPETYGDKRPPPPDPSR